MKLYHLLILNLAACLLTVLFTPVAVRKNADFSQERIAELKAAGVIDEGRLAAFAQAEGKPAMAHNPLQLVDWINDATATNNYLVFPAFMVFLLNTFLLLRLCIRERMARPCGGGWV